MHCHFQMEQLHAQLYYILLGVKKNSKIIISKLTFPSVISSILELVANQFI